MLAGDVLRLAWEAEHDGRTRLRDALLTLAVAESCPGDAWAERCRTRLVSDRPDHFFAHFATVARALEDPRVVDARDRLRLKYPPVRIEWLLLKARAARGPYLGRPESLDAMIEDLAGATAEAENVRRDAAQPSRGPMHRQLAPRPLAFALAYPSIPTGLEERPDRPAYGTSPVEDEAIPDPSSDDLPTYYLTVLLAIAILLASVQEAREGQSA
jgi:hypothetical protein